jgi:hypothetical protein
MRPQTLGGGVHLMNVELSRRREIIGPSGRTPALRVGASGPARWPGTRRDGMNGVAGHSDLTMTPWELLIRSKIRSVQTRP